MEKYTLELTNEYLLSPYCKMMIAPIKNAQGETIECIYGMRATLNFTSAVNFTDVVLLEFTYAPKKSNSFMYDRNGNFLANTMLHIVTTSCSRNYIINGSQHITSMGSVLIPGTTKVIEKTFTNTYNKQLNQHSECIYSNEFIIYFMIGNGNYVYIDKDDLINVKIGIECSVQC